ncbi:MAG TPA: hypothetical protein PKN95_04150 [Verrucomicrobiota bacterium]|nr:hypothetical protein [Verrucomicrobiota bacterium]HNT13600.1 hypothetical protein [Verrucomicrobiota bacterium]
MRLGILNQTGRRRCWVNYFDGFGRVVFLSALGMGTIASPALELKLAQVVAPPSLSGPEHKAITMLVEEVEKRTLIRWPVLNSWPASNVTTIVVGNRPALEAFLGSHAAGLNVVAPSSAPEGYQLVLSRTADQSTVLVIGNDARGVLFGVGRLLRELRMQRGNVSLSGALAISSAPKYPLRGHQVGYRPKTHSYDAWDLPVWEQYFRDLAVFGCNMVELIPPRSDDDADSPHFPRPPMEMMIGMSRLAAEYGLGVWIWYPALDKNYSDPKTVEAALREWGDVFAKLPRVDAVFVPGGDPGHTQPKDLMALLEKQTANLHRFHPHAQMWVSPQGFTQKWLDEFLEMLRRDQPAWLGGIVHGPQVRVSPKQLRALIPAKYPIRLYPDITHSQQCQYPVSQWDVAFSITAGREGINPRPVDHAIIARHTLPDSIGFGTYSEGCNDDLNKCLWSCLGWDPEADVSQVLREYSRYFIGAEVEESFAEGLFALERNWRGPLASNVDVEQTLARFQTLERTVRPATLRNWRFQQGLFRAYFDAYVRRRWLRETDLEKHALEVLRSAPALGSEKAMTEAQSILRQPADDPATAALRLRIFQLGEALFQSIAMQLSVTRYRAIDVDRGAMLDSMDYPLNNRPWLEQQFAAIRKLPAEPERLKALDEIVNWTNPGPGGFYDDLGNVAMQPHLLPGLSFAQDPDRFASPRVDFTEDLFLDAPDDAVAPVRRISWKDHAEALYDAPLEMLYDGLDRNARYRLRIIYAGDNTQKRIRLDANDTIEIHPLRTKPATIQPLEFDLPAAATASGRLKLTWRAEPGLGGNGRACQVSEVWLIKTSPTSSP